MTTAIPGIPDLGTEPPHDPLPLALESEDMGEPGERKRKRRRRKVEESPAPPPPPVSEEEQARVNTAFMLAFRVIGIALASKRGDHWRLTEEEERNLGAAWGVAIAPYLPKIGPAVPWAAAVAVTVSIGLSRVERDRQIAGKLSEAPELAGMVYKDGVKIN